MEKDFVSRLVGMLAVAALLAGCAAPAAPAAEAETPELKRELARLWRSMCIKVAADVPVVVQAREEGFEYELVRDMAIERVTAEMEAERPRDYTPEQAEHFDMVEDTVIRLTAMMVMNVFNRPHLDVEGERQSWTEGCISMLDR